METTKIVEILKQVDVNLFLKQNILKAVLADLLYEYEAERKILNTIHSSVNVVEKLYKSKNKLLEYQTIKQELLSHGLNESSVEWVLNIWSAVLDIQITETRTNAQKLEISIGGSFTTLLKNGQKLYSWGSNKWGQLGDGTLSDKLTPEEITGFLSLKEGETIINTISSFRSSYLLTSLGRVFAYGNNTYGQLGDITNINRTYPVEITDKISFLYNEKIIKIAAAGFHAILITDLNRVFVLGNNEYGQLGNGENQHKNVPYNITNQFNLKSDEKVEHVALGLGHSMLTTSLGRVYTWGNNKYGQLGDGSTTMKNLPVDITRYFAFLNNEKVQSISLGSLHTIVLTSIGRIFSFGNNENGQLGDLTTQSKDIPIEITRKFNLQNNEKMVKVIAGKNYSLALTSIGHVYSWGDNKNGQLGIEEYITGSVGPVDITNKLIKNEEDKIIDIFIGATSTHSYAVTSQGKIYGWGQLGDGSLIQDKGITEINIK